ncbi:MAG: ABC transporter permease, partial [Promethearchaeota archaeon]
MGAVLLDVGYLLNSAVLYGTPILIATLGEIYTERSGTLNLGVEGMMIIGAITAYILTYVTHNPWVGLIISMIMGSLFSLIHAFISITLHGNQIVSGLALTMLGIGITAVLGKPFEGTTIQDYSFSQVEIPFLSDIPIIGPGLFTADPIVMIGMISSIFLWYFLFKTKYGLTIRSVGENPIVADTLGINVYRVRYICVMVGGAFAGLAGAHLTIGSISIRWSEGMTAGRGWIAVGLTIFSIWNPLGALIGSYLFGLTDVLQFRLQPFGIPPQLLRMLPY